MIHITDKNILTNFPFFLNIPKPIPKYKRQIINTPIIKYLVGNTPNEIIIPNNIIDITQNITNIL